jgi:hypothetical protein
MSSTLESIWYVYGIVPGEFASGSLPEGLDDSRVVVERRGELAALVSVLDGASYAPQRVEESSGDVDWLSPRAMAHDRVLTWASDRGAVVPLPMFSLFSGRDAVCAMLDDRVVQLSSALDRVKQGREYSLRVYRVDAELLEVIPEMSPRLRELAAQAASASPGQRYLLERKLDGEKRGELRSVTQRVIDEITERLERGAVASVRSPIPRAAERATGGSSGTMVLNASFLVAPDALEEFQKTLTSIVGQHDQRGFRFDFTGPWPPYHFAQTSTADDGAPA